jgi:DNA polymerase family A
VIPVGTEGFREVWFVDFEFIAGSGDRPIPVCLVARELASKREYRFWREDLTRLDQAPYSTAEDRLFVSYYASAELGCHLALGWPLPVRVLDLYAEFRALTNGRPTPCGDGLLGALTFFGLDALESTEKDTMRELVLRGGPWSPEERAAILDYCASDVYGLERLLPRMTPLLDLPRALLRGRYMAAAARMEDCGVPIDTEAFGRLRRGWPTIQDRLIARVDQDYGVFDGRTFRSDRWATWLEARGIQWPRLASGRLALDDVTFRSMALRYPDIEPMRELRTSLAQLRLEDLAVGADGRNRRLLSAFRARTGRNQPSNSRFIFGPARWLRGLIRPEPGMGLAYVDWSQQEFGIAAALSKDPAMREAYVSGDPYLTFAKQAGVAPADATSQSHGAVRELFKACALAVQYGMGHAALAQQTGRLPAEARELLRLHHRTYREFWRWSNAVVDFAMATGTLTTAFGWSLHIVPPTNARSLRNFPMQANGAEMLRLACCLATERGIRVCAPVHDALLIEAPTLDLERAVDATQAAMAEASLTVLDGFPLRSAARLVRYPDRYQDERGARMWSLVWQTLDTDDADGSDVCASAT